MKQPSRVSKGARHKALSGATGKLTLQQPSAISFHRQNPARAIPTQLPGGNMPIFSFDTSPDRLWLLPALGRGNCRLRMRFLPAKKNKIFFCQRWSKRATSQPTSVSPNFSLFHICSHLLTYARLFKKVFFREWPKMAACADAPIRKWPGIGLTPWPQSHTSTCTSCHPKRPLIWGGPGANRQRRMVHRKGIQK
jgi:hypothetical protein